MKTNILLLVMTVLMLAPKRLLPQEGTTPPVGRQDFNFELPGFQLDGALLFPEGGGQYPLIVYVWGSGPTRMEQEIKTSQALRTFLESGYAVLLYDKPGSGNSTGGFPPGALFAQRTDILQKAISLAAEHPRVQKDSIGLYGSSQAIYVMALLLQRPVHIAFLATWSCPMENSIDQSAHQVEQFLRCAGAKSERAKKAHDAYVGAYRATAYQSYLKHAHILSGIPEVMDELGWGEVLDKKDFEAHKKSKEPFLDPAESLKDIQVPVLALYGEYDKNIDPVQAIAAWEGIAARNPHITVKTIPKADHNMIVGGTGCVQEQIGGYRGVPGRRKSEAFLHTIKDWLSTNQGF